MITTLSALRRNAGYISQESLGDAIGVRRTMIAKWETGDRYPRAPIIPKLAAALGVTEGEIIAAITAARQTSA